MTITKEHNAKQCAYAYRYAYTYTIRYYKMNKFRHQFKLVEYHLQQVKKGGPMVEPVIQALESIIKSNDELGNKIESKE